MTTRRGLTSDTASQNRLVMRPLPQQFDRAVVTVVSGVDIGNEAGGTAARTEARAEVTVRLGSSSRIRYTVRDPKAADVESLLRALADQAVQGEMESRRPCLQSAPSRPPRWDAAIENTCTRRTRLKVARTSIRNVSLGKGAGSATTFSPIKNCSRSGRRILLLLMRNF